MIAKCDTPNDLYINVRSDTFVYHKHTQDKHVVTHLVARGQSKHTNLNATKLC